MAILKEIVKQQTEEKKPMPNPNKQYLGSNIYVEKDGRMFKLTVENKKVTISFPPEVLVAMIAYASEDLKRS